MAARAAGAEMLAVLLGPGLPAAERVELANAPDRAGITPVFLAFQRGDEGKGAFEALLHRGARFNQQEMEQAGVLAATITGGSSSGSGGGGGRLHARQC
jgi:hypothetical protein